MQFELKNPMVPFILLCDAWNMLKYAIELYALSMLKPKPKHTNTIPKGVMDFDNDKNHLP